MLSLSDSESKLWSISAVLPELNFLQKSFTHIITKRFTSMNPWENFAFPPFVLIYLTIKSSNRNARKTVSRSFIGSDGFWFSASCYSPLSFSKDSQPVGSGTLLSQLLWCSVIETSSSMVTRKNKRAHTSSVSTYWTDFEQEWTQYSSRIPSGNEHW